MAGSAQAVERQTLIRRAIGVSVALPSTLAKPIGAIESIERAPRCVAIHASDGLVAASADGSLIYKLFTRELVAESLLDKLFISRDVVEQIRWEAYPVLRPSADLPSFRVAEGLFWVSAMEYAVSTMETQAVAARNVANLVTAELASRS